MIYLDHHSVTRPCGSAVERMMPYLQEHWGASISPHHLGAPYQALFDFFGASSKDRFVFTSSGAEAINQVFWSIFLEISRKTGKCHFIISCVEDAPMMQSVKRLEELGCTIKIAPVNGQGQIDVEQLASLINPRTALISVTMAHGLTGVIQPIEEIALLAKEKNVCLHVDATYSAGKYPVSFSDLGAHYLTFSGDRIHAVKGSGGLFAKAGSPLVPLIVGGAEQEGFRGGAFDVPSFMALCAALTQASLYLDTMSLEGVRLRNLLESEIVSRLPGSKALFTDTLRLPNTAVLFFPRTHHEALLYLLNRKGVYASMGGTYCQHLNRVLMASGIDAMDAECALSFSLSRMTTEEEIMHAAALIQQSVTELQAISEDIF